MNHRSRSSSKTGIAVVSLVTSLFLLSCAPKSQPPQPAPAVETPAPAPQAAIPATPAPKTAPVLRAALVTFVTGTVTVTYDGKDFQADLGVEVPVDSVVITGKDSRCDLQFGSLGTLRIQEETAITLKEIAVSETRRVASAKLAIGSIAAKVSKLASTDRFNISTKEAVCGVRGTEFIVRSSGMGSTKVSVKEGSVALLPPAFDPAKIEGNALGKAIAPAVDAVFVAMLEAAPKIEAMQESTIGEKDLAKASEAWTGIEIALNEAVAKSLQSEAPPATAAETATATQGAESSPQQAPAAPAIAIDPAMLLESSGMKTSLAALTSTSVPLAKKTKAATKASSKELETFASMAIYEVPSPAAAPTISTSPAAATPASGQSVSAEQAPANVLVPVNIICEPKEAEIHLDGQRVGTGAASVLRVKGTKIQILVKCAGYDDAKFEAKAGESKELEEAIRLKPKAKSEAPSNPAVIATPPAPASVPIQTAIQKPLEARYAISASPAGAIVTLVGGMGKEGRAEGAFVDDKALGYEVSLEGYETRSGQLTPKPGETVSASIELAALPVFARFATGTAKPVGTVVALADGALFLDAKGVLYRVTTKGLLWKAATGNALAENAVALVGEGIAYVAGDKNLTVISLADGSTLTTIALDETNSGLFGRRPALFGGELYLSATDGLRVLNASNGKQIRAIAFADGSDMTPRVVDGSLVLADRKGRFVKIDPATGRQSYATATKAVQPVALAPTVAGGKAFFADRKGLVVAVDLASGAILWSKSADDTGKAIFDDLLVAGKAVWCYSKATITALSTATGERIMPAITNAAAPPFAAQGLVWAPMKDGRLVAHDPSTGKEVKSLKLDGVFSARPVELKGFFVCPLASGELAVMNPAAAK